MSVRPPRLPCWLAALVLAALGAAATPEAAAFCGFFVAGSNQKLYNNASQVVLLRKGNHTVMTMSNNYKGPPEDFAMVVPVPVVLKKQQVRTPSAKVFAHVDELTAPRLVEYWEQDPCDNDGGNVSFGALGGRMAPRPKAARSRDDSAADYHVKIEAQFDVGEYDILILSAEEASGLEAWLRLQKYNIPQGASAALAPYIQDQMKFFVAKVNIQKVRRAPSGVVVLSPLQFSYDANELRLPVRLGLLNAEEKQDLLVYILHPSKRFETANYPSVFIPTNLEVVDRVRQSFAGFYAELFDETLRRQNNRAVVTEYAWDTGSCDPCPTPPLGPGDLATLGASHSDAQNESWVVTRLHTRYDKQTLSEDLLFRAARPAVGGRADRDDGGGPWKAAVRGDESNNFQARYIIRHYWGRKAKCEKPEYNVWGGPPNGRAPRPQAAGDLASAPRGQLALATVVKTKVPPIGLNGLVKSKDAAPAAPVPPKSAPTAPQTAPTPPSGLSGK
ncbi:MAG TPA: DUF2330 domain-containing protein [Pseudomonadota bacterium]|nr:DUF2330 domain-containing protein [Pseudomonadota bacterium]